MVNDFNPNIELSFYKTIILDVDGVIFDSNNVKKENIFKATETFTNYNTANNFTSYFIGLSGIPREQKIKSYFKGQHELADKILTYYNSLNDKSIYSVQLTPDAFKFIELCFTYKKTIIALSGGAENELHKLFNLHKLNKYFKYVFGGPKTKEENINGVLFNKPILYIGDSAVDFETAEKLDAKFVFMSGYTGFQNWQSFIEEKKHLSVINALTELISNNSIREQI